MRKFIFLIALCAASLGAQEKASDTLTPQLQSQILAVPRHMSAASLRGHLSFLASDLLEGRATPSRGLDLAAEYIAAQFRRAGLELVGDDGYFQTATMVTREPNWAGFEMSITAGGTTVSIDKSEVYLAPDHPLALDNVPLVAFTGGTPEPQQINGKVVFVTDPRALRALRGYQPALLL